MIKKVPCIIFGTGAVSGEVAYLIQEINEQSLEKQYDLLGFVCAGQEEIGGKVGEYPILCSDSQFAQIISGYSELAVFIPMANPRIKKNIHQKIADFTNLSFPNLIHPRVNTRNLTLGVGNIIQENVSISIDVKMKDFNMINYAVFLGHDMEMGSYNTVNPQAKICGNVKMEEQCFVGVGATVLQNLKIGSGSTVGAGALVRQEVKANQTVVGIPARPISK